MERETRFELATSSLGSSHSGREAKTRWLRGAKGQKQLQVWKRMEVGVARAIEELRQSSYHQELGRKMCAAFLAQQQGITLSTAMKKISTPVGDLWLMIADFAEQAVGKAMDLQFPSGGAPRSTGLLM